MWVAFFLFFVIPTRERSEAGQVLQIATTNLHDAALET